MPQGPCCLSTLSWRTQILSHEHSNFGIQLLTYTMGDRVMMAKFLGQVDMEFAGLARYLVELEEQEMRWATRQRIRWTNVWLVRRPLHCQYEALMAELELDDSQAFLQFMPVDVATFHDILARNEGRSPSSPGPKLSFILRYLATTTETSGSASEWSTSPFQSSLLRCVGLWLMSWNQSLSSFP